MSVPIRSLLRCVQKIDNRKWRSRQLVSVRQAPLHVLSRLREERSRKKQIVRISFRLSIGKLNHFTTIRDGFLPAFLYMSILVHKCSDECTPRKTTEYYIEYSCTNPRITLGTQMSHEYCSEYADMAHTTEILRVHIRVVWVLLVASRTRLLSTFTRAVKHSRQRSVSRSTLNSLEH